MKIALGTVQWGLDYGIANSNGIPSDTELKRIISIADEYGVALYDTAVHYGNAEKRIGQFVSTENKIITKIGAFSKVNPLEKQLEQSFKNLNRIKIYGCLFHNSEELLDNKSLWFDLLRFKEEDKIEKIGYSLYEPAIMLRLLEEGMIPDIVQLPYSILDRKFEPYFQLLKDKGVEIHVRSVFLQGLYFKNRSELSGRLNDFKSILKVLNKICSQNKINMSQFCLEFIYRNKSIDYAVIGIDNVAQLQKHFFSKTYHLKWESILKTIELYPLKKELLNPSNW